MRKGAVDYRRLAAADSGLSLGLDPLGTDFRALHAELLTYGGYRSGSGVRKVSAAQLTPEWLQQNGAFRPVLVPASPGGARELGIALHDASPTVDRLASRIGLPFEVHTMDVQTQGEGPRWTMHQWCLYWDARRAASREPPALAASGAAAGGGAQPAVAPAQRAPRPAEDEADSAAVKRKRSAEEEAAAQQLKGISADSRKRLLEVAALPLTGTPLEAEVSPPAAVRGVDLAQQVWPRGAPSRPVATVNLVMSPEGAYSDFHLGQGGASVWLHCLSGRRVLALVPPTPRNLATFAAWAASARQAGAFLPAHCEGVVRAELGPGKPLQRLHACWARPCRSSALPRASSTARRRDTLIIPGGWAHAAATTSSALLLGGSFLRRDALAIQLEAWRIEDHLGVRPRFRYPAFKQVLWYAAAAFSRRLRRLAGLSPAQLQERAAAAEAAAAEQEQREAAARAQAGGQASGDSGSVSKAGAAKRHKGWQGGDQAEADDAGTRPRKSLGGGAGPRAPQAPAAGPPRPTPSPGALAGFRAAGSPAAPRQVGRAMGGGSRLNRGGGVGAGAKKLPRMNPTQLSVDVRGSGAGGAGGRRTRRQRSPDSFIEKGSEDESGGAGGDDDSEDGAEWAPAGAAGGDGLSEDDELSDASEEGGARRPAGAVVVEVGEDGEPVQRRLTARQAARQAAVAAAWDGRIAARQAAVAGPAGWSEREEEWDEGEPEGWGGGGGGGGRRGRQATRFGGRLPPRLAAMLQEEEAEEEEEPPQPPPVAADATAVAALAAFAAADQQQQQQQQAAQAGLKPVRIKVRAPATAAAPAGTVVEPPALDHQPQQQPPAAGGQKLKIKIKPAAQQQQEAAIPQVDGAGDDVQAMYDALYSEGRQAPQQHQDGPPPAAAETAAQLPAVLAAPLGRPGQPRAGTAAVVPQPQQPQPQRSGSQHGEAAHHAGNGAATQAAPADDGGAAAQGAPASGPRRPSDGSQGQLEGGGRGGLVAAVPAGASPSVEGPAASGQRAAAAEPAVSGPAAAEPAASQQAAAAQASAGAEQQQEQPDEAAVVSGEHRPAGSAGAAAPRHQDGAAANGSRFAQQPPGGAAVGAPGGLEGESDEEGGAPPEPLSLEEEEGLAALLAALRQWLRAPNALNDVPLSIANPRAVAARLEVCMRALGLSLSPPQPVDLESVPLERLLPARTPRAGGALVPQPSHQTPQTLGGSEFVPGELDAVGEAEEGGEFDPADLEEDGGPVVEESAGPKRKPGAATAQKAGLALAGGSAGRAPALQPAKRAKGMSIKDRLKKKLRI